MISVRLLLLLVSLPLTSLVSAGSGYVGPFYGKITIDEEDSAFEVENGMLGLMVGSTGDSGIGFEMYYASHLGEDTIEIDGRAVAEAMITSFGILAVYRTRGQFYLKLKAGYATTDLEIDLDAGGQTDDDTSGLAYGGAVGYDIGHGALELGYLVLPEFDDFEGLDFNADIDMVTLGYNWNF